MKETVNWPITMSRRSALQLGGALALSSVVPRAARAQTRRYRRTNVSGAAGKKALASYRKAVRAMLALPPSDARNWYRIALVHALDCPHGNWWFLPWHRGFLGYFEQICRELSGDPDFALPYWDWTAEPRIPAEMFDDVLTPTDAGTRIEGSRDDTFVMQLTEHSGGGYVWDFDQLVASGFVIVADHRAALDPDGVGGPVVRRVTAAVDAADRGRVSVEERRPWQPAPPASSLTFDFDMTGPEPAGLSRADRRRFLEAA